MKVPCPSGLIFSARGWKIGDHASMLDMKDELAGGLPKLMVKLASQSVIDPGPYKMTAGGPVDWDIVSHADIAVANVLIRAGKDPELRLMPNCVSCRKLQRDAKEVNLLDLPVFEASEQGKTHLSSGVPINDTIQGIPISFKAILGKDMLTVSILQEQEEQHMLEITTCMGIASISPKGQEPLTSLPDIRKFWREQDMTFMQEVETKLDTLFGGVDMTYRFTCDHLTCRAEQEQSVPLDLSFYGLDLAGRQSRRARSSTGKSVRELMQRASSPSSASSPAPPASISGPSPK